MTPKILKQTAAQALSHQAQPARLLILIHSGAVAVLTLLLAFVDHLLDLWVGTTGGLSGMELKGMLTTAQTFLQFSYSILLPFWQIGYLAVALGILREQPVSKRTLFAGFEKWGSVLRLSLCQIVVYLTVGSIAATVASTLFSMTPYYEPLMQQMLPLLESQTTPDDAAFSAMIDAYIPLLVMFGIVFLALFLPVFYRLRMAPYLLMGTPEHSAVRAMVTSVAMMRKQKLSLFRLDLSFWWFYLLELVIAVICYADILLPALGVSLPLSESAGYFLFLVLSSLVQLGLYCWKKNDLEVTYAAFFEGLTFPETPVQANSQELQ